MILHNDFAIVKRVLMIECHLAYMYRMSQMKVACILLYVLKNNTLEKIGTKLLNVVSLNGVGGVGPRGAL